MPETLSELFNGGLVTARHPALLTKGELQRADDCVYREKDPAIFRAPGRKQLNATALSGAIKGMAHLSFQRSELDQLLVYTGTVFAAAALTASSAPTIDVIDGVISCGTTSASPNITSGALFGNVQVGWNVTGSNIPVGTQVKTVTNSSNIVLTLNATSTATVNLTFNPMLEIGGSAAIAGTISGTTTFTATTGYPFLADVVGARLYIAGAPSVKVTAVSGQSGTTGHYNIITLDTAQTNGALTIAFAQGCVQTLSDITGDMLDFAQYGNAYFVWTANNGPQRVSWQPRVGTDGLEYRKALSMRPMGLKPVVTAPVITLVTNATYGWPSTLETGYYWFLITEIFDPASSPKGIVGPEEIESTYEGGVGDSKIKGVPISINVTELTTKGVQIALPRQVNTGADGRISNYWGIYMYGPSDTVPSLAAFRRVRKVAMTDLAPLGTQIETLYETPTKETQYSNGAASVAGFAAFSSPSLMAGGAGGYTDGGVASASSGGSAGESAVDLTFPSFVATGNVTGIKVSLRMHVVRGTETSYRVKLLSGSKKTAETWAIAKARGIIYTETHGSDGDTWAVTWAAAGDFVSGTFKLRLVKSGSASIQQLDVDGVEVTIYYGSATINLNGLPYRIVTYRDQIGDVVNVPARGVIPKCNTGDLFQGSVVVNDLSEETAVRYSLPGEPESFPPTYVLRLNTTKRRDRVTFIRKLGLILIVGLENGIQRINYLPTEQDTDFQSGLAHDDIASDHGIPGPLAGTHFDWPGRGTVIAYATGAGVFYTDGLTTTPLNMDLDWVNTVKVSALPTCVFRVYPKEKWLVLYYCPAGATHNKNTRALVFHYAADKVKNGNMLPALGPIKVSGCSAIEALLSGSTYLLTGHESNGYIYQEDYGTVQAATYEVLDAADSLSTDHTPISPIVRTRRIYPAGITHDCHLYKAYVLQSLFGATYTAVADSTINTATLSATTGVFASWLKGMRVKGEGLDEGTIVLSVATDGTSITLSRVANATGTSVTFTADTGTIAITNRGCSIGEVAAGMHTVYGSSLASDMIVVTLDDTRQGLELQIEKVPIGFTSHADGYRSDSDEWADLGVNMRLHQCMILYDDQGAEQTRSTV